MTSKEQIRRAVRASRSEQELRERDRIRQGLRQQAFEIGRLATTGVAGFQPTNDEPDVRGLLLALMREHHVYLPRVAGRELEWVEATPDHLRGALRGIPKPSGATVCHSAAVAQHVSVILVPALAIDAETGHRIGYGGGYYDRLLAALPPDAPHLVGVCRAADLMPVDPDPFDVPVQAILTEAGYSPVAAPR